jgi:hypothetical protein
MANEQKINEFIDFSALENEKQRVVKVFTDLVSELQSKTSGKVSFMGDAKNITEATKAIQENEQAAKKQKETIDKTSEAYLKQKQIDEEIIRLKKLETAATNEQISAFTRLKAQAGLATENYRKLAAQYGKNSLQAREAGKEAAKLNNKIADINKTAGISNNLVGRYTEGITNAVKRIGAAIVAAFAVDKIIGFFKSGMDMSIKWEERNARLLFTLNGNKAAFDRMSASATELSKTSLFKKSAIADAQILSLQLGRSEEQTNKMITAAMGLARVTGVDLSAAMQTMSMTLEGSKGRLGRIVGEVKNMSEEELKAGKAIDIVNERFGKFGKEGLETTGGKLIMLSKEFDGFKRKLVGGTGGKGVFNGLIEGAKSLVGWLNNNVAVVGKIIVEIARFLTVVVAWKVGTMAAAAAQSVWTAATQLYTIVAKRAKTATMALNTAQKSNIWGLIAAAIALAATYLIKFTGSMNEAQKKTEDFKKSLSGAVGESNSLFEQLKKTNPGTKERADLIGLINEKYGDYIKGIDLEKAGLREIEAAQAAVNNELITNLTLNAKQAEITGLAQAQADILLQLGKKGVFLNDLTEGKGALKKYVIWADNEIEQLSEGYFQLERQINEVGKTYDDIAEGIRSALVVQTDLQKKNTEETKKGTEAEKVKEFLTHEQIESILQLMESRKQSNKILSETEQLELEEAETLQKAGEAVQQLMESIRDSQPEANEFLDWWKSLTDIEKAQQVVDLFSKLTGVVSDFSEISDENGKKEVENFKVQQDEKLRVLNERLRLGFISEEQYIADKSDLELQFEAKKKEIEKREFERKKKLAYAEAVINGASAAISALTEKTLAMKVITLAFVALKLAAQLSKISNSSPGYAKGRKDGPGEWAKVGEQGWEYTGDENSIFKTPNSTTLTYLKPHQWVMPHAESVQLEKVLGTPTVNQITTQKPQQQQDKELIKAIDRLAKKPTAVVNMDAHGIRAALTQGANSMNFVNNHILFKN